MSYRFTNTIFWSLALLIFWNFNLQAQQQDVFSRSEVTTGDFGSGQLPWFYATSNNTQGDPDNNTTQRNFVKIGHNNNTSMTTNGRFYLVNTLDFQAGATSPRTINNSGGGGLSASGGIFNLSTATHTFNTPIGIDGAVVNIHANNTGGLVFNQTIFINNNSVNFGNTGSGQITVNGVMEGSGGIQKFGNNTLVLTGNNTYSGTTSVDVGTLILRGNISNSDIIVKTGATLEIDDDLTVKSITVEPGGFMKINSGFNLTVSDALVLNSNSTSYSSLISDGTVTGNVLYNRYVNTNASESGNDLISAPVTGQAFNDFIDVNTNIRANPNGTNVLFGGYDTASGEFELWDEEDTFTLEPGEGYRSGIEPGESNLVQFNGTINTGNVGISINNGASSKFNLIGNPYTSFLSVSDFLSTNEPLMALDAVAVYGYNDNTAGTGNKYTILNKLSNYNMTPGQGFFVTSNTTGGIIQFQPAMRRATGADDFILGREAQTFSKLNLILESATNRSTTEVYFTEFSSEGLDPGYDASVFRGIPPDFSIYSHLVDENQGTPFALQALGATDYNETTIPLGVNASQGEQISFSLSESTLPTGIAVFLDDTVTNNSTLLTQGDYVLTPTSNLDGTGRFFLRLESSALHIGENTLNSLNVFYNTSLKHLEIIGKLGKNPQCNIIDIQGHLIGSYGLDSNLNKNQIKFLNLSSGIYVVRIKDNNQEKTLKVILN